MTGRFMFQMLLHPIAMEKTIYLDQRVFKWINGSFHLKVWSQWGELIFESTDVDQLWDGKTKTGLNAPIDNYVWSIRIYDN